MKKNNQYLWDRKTGTSLQFWPKKSTERSLIKPTVPLEYVSNNPNDSISAPPPLPIKILRERGIQHGAISEHDSGFYTQRANENFNYVSFTLGGSVILKIDGKKIRLKKGMMFYASSKSEYTLEIPKYWHMFFFHMEKSPRWNFLTNSVYIVKQAKFLDEIKFPTFNFFNEVYKEKRSLRLLEIYADMIEIFLRREISGNYSDNISLDNILHDLRTTPIQTKQIAKQLGMNTYEFDKFCIKNYGLKFAKLVEKTKMQRAKNAMLATLTPNISKIALDCGYANVHSFSRAFSRYFKISPSKFIEKIGK